MLELSIEDESHCQSLIGVLTWTVEQGRVDILIEVSIMAGRVALPREVHLELFHRIFAHIKKNHSTKIFFDPFKPSINNSDLERNDWSFSEFSRKIQNKSELHPRAPTPIGMGLIIVGKVDTDHGGDSVARR